LHAPAIQLAATSLRLIAARRNRIDQRGIQGVHRRLEFALDHAVNWNA
jgi:hypothetical protein